MIVVPDGTLDTIVISLPGSTSTPASGEKVSMRSVGSRSVDGASSESPSADRSAAASAMLEQRRSGTCGHSAPLGLGDGLGEGSGPNETTISTAVPLETCTPGRGFCWINSPAGTESEYSENVAPRTSFAVASAAIPS